MNLRLIPTPDDSPIIAETQAREQIAERWREAQAALADLLVALPSVAALVHGKRITLTPHSLRLLSRDAARIVGHVSRIADALAMAADVADRGIVTKTDSGVAE